MEAGMDAMEWERNSRGKGAVEQNGSTGTEISKPKSRNKQNIERKE